ncbi:MAG TPA: serine/threonine protein kinase, partial [Clostridiales bacterium]|nr:serine/threonine protein kinase [Clostridiales bacterium]
MDTVNGYQIRKPFSSENAGFCRWAIGEKHGRAYFIKEFLSPKYPADDCGLSEKTIAKKRAECEKFYNRKAKLYQAIQQCRTGNVVIIQDFFREGSKYYAVTEQVKAENLSLSQIAALPENKKMTLIRAILYSFSVLHSKAIVHSDVKPDNILVKRTENNFYTGKIIDFDASFLETEVPEEIAGDQVYLAPETRRRMMEEPVSVTTKADIFALGILFHQYWCGELPGCPKEYDYLFEAVLDG